MAEAPEVIAETRDFPLSGILGVTTGHLLGDIGELYDVLGFMTNGPIWTHEIPSAMRIAAPEISRQHPDLPTDADVHDEATVRVFMSDAVARYGATLTLTPIPDYARTKGPAETAADIIGADRVIEIEVPS